MNERIRKPNRFIDTPQRIKCLRQKMPKYQYKFTRRNNSISGFLSQNHPSTDAINALIKWKINNPKRDITIISDEPESLTAELTWSETDETAGVSLDDVCNEHGVEKTPFLT